MRLFSLFLFPFVLLLLNSCAGYRLGGSKPEPLAHVEKLHVPLATNSTQIPRAGAYVTNGVVDALVQDGTYRLGTAEDSQATLEIDFYTVKFGALRTAEINRLRPEEQTMTVQLRWRVLDAQDPLKVLDSGVSIGRTNLFVDPNLQTAQQSAFSDAVRRAALSLSARLADGF